MTNIAYLIAKMKAIPEGTGTLLDNSILHFSSEMAEGWHSFDEMPIVLAGKAGGQLTSGRHIKLPSGTELCNYHLALCRLAGLTTLASFGHNGTSPVTL
jgi:hypothetical protein